MEAVQLLLHKLLNTVAYVQRALSKDKTATIVFSVEENEIAKAINFKLLQREKSNEEIKSFKAEKRKQKFYIFYLPWITMDLNAE